MKIAIGSDHGGFELKEFVKDKLLSLGHDVEDFGCHNLDSVDYPDYGSRAAQAVSKKKADRGIVICTTGIGMSMVANKVKGVRAALCHDPWGAKMSRNHNDANVLVLGAAFVGKKLTEEILKVWLSEGFEGGRHQARVEKIMDIERGHKDGTSQKN
jgi:ribose 5-phosphate isomerase B